MTMLPLFVAFLLSATLTAPQAVAQGPAVTTSGKPSADEKRCLAAKRRVTRQQEVVADVAARTIRERRVRDTCATKQLCARADRALKASETRKTRYDRQLAQFESEAANLCRMP